MNSVNAGTVRNVKPVGGVLSLCGCGHRIPTLLIKAALRFGRAIETPGLTEHVVEEPEVRFWRRHGVSLELARGVRVFCDEEGEVYLVFRAHDCEGPASSEAS